MHTLVAMAQRFSILTMSLFVAAAADAESTRHIHYPSTLSAIDMGPDSSHSSTKTTLLIDTRYYGKTKKYNIIYTFSINIMQYG